MEESVAHVVFETSFNHTISKGKFFSVVLRNAALQHHILDWARRRRPEILGLHSSIQIETATSALWRQLCQTMESTPASLLIARLKDENIINSSGITNSSTTATSTPVTSPAAPTRSPSASHDSASHHEQAETQSSGGEAVVQCRVRGTFTPEGPGEMYVARDDIVAVKKKELIQQSASTWISSGWITAHILVAQPAQDRSSAVGDHGFIPCSYVVPQVETLLLDEEAPASFTRGGADEHMLSGNVIHEVSPMPADVSSATPPLAASDLSYSVSHSKSDVTNPLNWPVGGEKDDKPLSASQLSGGAKHTPSNGLSHTTTMHLSPLLSAAQQKNSSEYFQGYMDALARVKMELQLEAAELSASAVALLHADQEVGSIGIETLTAFSRRAAIKAQADFVARLEQKQREIQSTLLSSTVAPPVSQSRLASAGNSPPGVRVRERASQYVVRRHVDTVNTAAVRPTTAAAMIMSTTVKPASSNTIPRHTLGYYTAATAPPSNNTSRSSSVSAILRQRFTLGEPDPLNPSTAFAAALMQQRNRTPRSSSVGRLIRYP